MTSDPDSNDRQGGLAPHLAEHVEDLMMFLQLPEGSVKTAFPDALACRDRFIETRRPCVQLSQRFRRLRRMTVSFVLMRQFTMLAFTSAIEALRVANQLAGQVQFRWHVYSEDGQLITCSNGVPVMPGGPLPAKSPAG